MYPPILQGCHWSGKNVREFQGHGKVREFKNLSEKFGILLKGKFKKIQGNLRKFAFHKRLQ